MERRSSSRLLVYPASVMLGVVVAWCGMSRQPASRQASAAPAEPAPELLERAPSPVRGSAAAAFPGLRRVQAPGPASVGGRITAQPLTEQGVASGAAVELRPGPSRWLELPDEPGLPHEPGDTPPWNLVAWRADTAAPGLRWIVPAVDEVLLAAPATQRRSMRVSIAGLDPRACTLASSQRPGRALAPLADGRVELDDDAQSPHVVALHEGDGLVASRRLHGAGVAPAGDAAQELVWEGRAVLQRFEVEHDRQAGPAALHLRWTAADGRSAFEVGRKDSPDGAAITIKLLAGCAYDYLLWADGCEPVAGALVAGTDAAPRHRLVRLPVQPQPVVQVLDARGEPAAGVRVAMLPSTRNAELATDLLVSAVCDESGLARAVLPATLPFEIAARSADGGWARTILASGRGSSLPVLRLRRAHRVELALLGTGVALEPFQAGPLEWRADRLDGSWSGGGTVWPPWILDDLPAGEANLHVRLAGGTWSGSVCVEIGAGSGPVPVLLEAAPEATGIVVDAAGRPICGAVVELAPDSWSAATRSAFGSAVCDANGRFHVRLPGGAPCVAHLLREHQIVASHLLEAGQEIRWSVAEGWTEHSAAVGGSRN